MKLALLIFIIYFSLINLSSHHYVLADYVISAQAGGTFSSKSREPKYKIEFHPEDAPFSPDDDQESVIMPDKNGQKFLCYLPKLEKVKVGKLINQQNTSSVIVESEERTTLKTPDELLEILQGQCLIRQEGWWLYEFCYQKKLRQIHLDDDKVVQEFVLGVFDSEVTTDFNQNQSGMFTVKDPRSKDASQKYHAHQYTNGTICDLTNQPRETEVRFVCSESRAMITSMTELSTCKYALTVQFPMLCKHPLFKDEGPVWHVINCNALPKDYKETKVEGNSFMEKQLKMVNDIKYPTHYDSEYAT